MKGGSLTVRPSFGYGGPVTPGSAFRRLALVMTGLFLLAATDQAAVKRMSVQVRSAPLRATPSFLGKIGASLAYGDRVEVVETKADWMQVKLEDGRSGWLHASALTEKKVVLKAGAEDVDAAASGKEVALAGKGFNKQVEESYRGKNAQLDYARVDQMERMNTTAQERESFLKQGGLSATGGGQ